MKKVRVYEVSKNTGIPSKEIVDILKNLNIDSKGHMSALEDEQVNYIFEYLTQKYLIEDSNLSDIFDLNYFQNRLNESYAVNSNSLDNSYSKEEDTATGALEAESSNEKTKNAAVGKNVILVDTRAGDIDIEKLDSEKIEELLPEALEDVTKKIEKIKKNPKSKKIREEIYLKKETKKEYFEVKLPLEIMVSELSRRINKPPSDIIEALMSFGVMVTINQTIDFDTASTVVEELGGKASLEIVVTDEERLFDVSEDNLEDSKPRPPVVVVMGHVDHGKTSLLDTIRRTNVAKNESGGITQHIGAYSAYTNGQKVTFLDTPGHEAFTEMRARGAQVTDIAVLVVAADDGIMPQTIEAINHAKEANVSIIVAINKIDKEEKNPEKVKQELTGYGLVPEEWGGNTICVEISATNNINIDKLLEMILLVSEIKELKANPKKRAVGTVIESYLDKGRGPVSTFLVKNGTLRTGETVISGTTVGKIRTMINDKGKIIRKAGPSEPVEVIGLPNVCECGDMFYAVSDEKKAKQISEKRKTLQKQEKNASKINISLENLFECIESGKMKELNIIVKADTRGSAEAIKNSLEKITNEEVRIKIIHDAVGAINESDVVLASASNAIIVGFNVRPTSRALNAALLSNVTIKVYRVIYEALEDIEKAIKGMREPTFKEAVIGHAEIRNIFKVSGIGTIGGAYVTDGKIQKSSRVRVVRDGILVHESSLASLKRFKNDAKEVLVGYECGISVENFNDIKIGDVIESFMMEKLID